jgi:hypothetical protein
VSKLHHYQQKIGRLAKRWISWEESAKSSKV